MVQDASLTGKTNNPTEVLIELLRATGRHDRQAFSRLYRLTSPKLYAVAIRILKNEQSAQDCIQDSYLSVWQHAAAYQSGRAAPMTWMTTIVRNRAIDLLRKQPLDPLKTEVEARLVLAMGEADNHINDMAISQCLEELRPEYRECVLQAYYAGLTNQELAEEKDLPLGTVKTWIRRALEQLRQCLQP